MPAAQVGPLCRATYALVTMRNRRDAFSASREACSFLPLIDVEQRRHLQTVNTDPSAQKPDSASQIPSASQRRSPLRRWLAAQHAAQGRPQRQLEIQGLLEGLAQNKRREVLDWQDPRTVCPPGELARPALVASLTRLKGAATCARVERKQVQAEVEQLSCGQPRTTGGSKIKRPASVPAIRPPTCRWRRAAAHTWPINGAQHLRVRRDGDTWKGWPAGGSAADPSRCRSFLGSCANSAFPSQARAFPCSMSFRVV